MSYRLPGDTNPSKSQQMLISSLRRGVDTNSPPDLTDEVMARAADEIERLCRDNEAYKATLSGTVKLSGHGPSIEQSQRVEKSLCAEIERLRASNAELLQALKLISPSYLSAAARAAVAKAEAEIERLRVENAILNRANITGLGQFEKAEDSNIALDAEIEQLKREREEWNGKHQLACIEIERLHAGLDKIESLLIEAEAITYAGQMGDPNGANHYQAHKRISDARAAIAKAEGHE